MKDIQSFFPFALGIMSTFGLLENFEDVGDPKKYKQHKAFNDASDEHINKSLFKDKKLNKLWDKAEQSGFTGKCSQDGLCFAWKNKCSCLHVLPNSFQSVLKGRVEYSLFSKCIF
jgi:hypothetical protein